MSESSENYSPSQILAIGQRAESEGKFDYATQFYTHLADHYRNTAEGHEALYGLQRIEHYRQTHFAAQARAAHEHAQANHFQEQQAAQRREPQPLLQQQQQQQQHHQQQRQPTPQAAPRQVRAEQTGHLHDWHGGQERAATANATAARSSLPVRVSDHDEDEDAGLPRLVARHTKADQGEDHYIPEYRLGRFLTVILAVVGWTMLVIGFVLLVAGLAGVHSTVSAAGLAGLPAGVELGVSAISTGFIMLFMAHLARAVFDSAGAARELVEIERAKAGW